MEVKGENTTPNDAVAHGLQLPDVPPGASQLDTTIHFPQQHINSEFSKLDAGTINTLSEQTMSLLDKLVSLTSSKNGVCPSASDSQSAAASPSLMKNLLILDIAPRTIFRGELTERSQWFQVYG